MKRKSIDLPEDVLQRLEILAAADHRKPKAFIEMLVINEVKRLSQGKQTKLG